jgi:hypothetical protein
MESGKFFDAFLTNFGLVWLLKRARARFSKTNHLGLVYPTFVLFC